MKQLKFIMVFAMSLAGCVAPQEGAWRKAGPLSLWRDGAPAKAALLDYVAAATKEGSPGYIPPSDRVAVFDFDGTLFCETDPTYLDWMLFDHRVLDDPSYRATEEQLSVAREARAKGSWPGLNHSKRERLMAEVWDGITPEAMASYMRTFIAGPQPGFTGMKRGEAFYRPMVEVVRFLEANGFMVYVCSGTERFALRAVVGDGLALPPRQIIGTDYRLVAAAQGDRDGLAFTYGTNDVLVVGGKLLVKNLQMNKVPVIAREIGVRPVLAFGNSFSDASMLNYTLQNKRYRSLGFMLLCDDTVREHGNPAKAEKMRKACLASGWIPVSMRDDWTTIYGPGVTRK
ncbi:MAG: haloacid dehalogenase-like hydrolase [Kiritimatiellae bacterium]|nr:haloacid dehalogenase-like hydrolase [Kiritimatiellia bacterium]